MKTNGKHEVMARIAGQSLVLAALLAMVISAASISRAQSSATSPATPAAKLAALSAKGLASPGAKPAAKGQHEGITMHGHWIIEVKNPDGTMTARREFENAIQSPGMSYLASLLAGNNTPGALSIFLNGANVQLPFTDQSFAMLLSGGGPCGSWPDATQNQGAWLISGSGTCIISIPTGFLGATCVQLATYLSIPATALPCSTNLVVTGPQIVGPVQGQSSPDLPNGFIGGGTQLSLMGSVTATGPKAGTVNDVETYFETCGANLTIAQCLAIGAPVQGGAVGTAEFPVAVNPLTMRSLDGQNGDPAAVPYSPGQIISVSVTLSFQ